MARMDEPVVKICMSSTCREPFEEWDFDNLNRSQHCPRCVPRFGYEFDDRIRDLYSSRWGGTAYFPRLLPDREPVDGSET